MFNQNVSYQLHVTYQYTIAHKTINNIILTILYLCGTTSPAPAHYQSPSHIQHQ